MSIQDDIDKQLLNEVLTTKQLRSKEELQREYEKDQMGFYNKSRYNCFMLAYDNLVNLKIIHNGQLNSIYVNKKKSYVVDIDNIVEILRPNIQYYRYKLAISIEKSLDGVKIKSFKKASAYKQKKYTEYFEFNYKQSLDKILDDIHDLLDRFINNSKSKPIEKYESELDIFRQRQSYIEMFFKDVIFEILNGSLSEISKETIENNAKKYIDYSFEYADSMKDNIKSKVINALKLLKIIIDETETQYIITPILEQEWKMNARTKSESIHILVGGLTSIKDNIKQKDIDRVHEIFNFDNS